MCIQKQDRKRARAVMVQFEIDEAQRNRIRAENKLIDECTLQPKMEAYLKSDEGKADIKDFVADKLERLGKVFGVKF